MSDSDKTGGRAVLGGDSVRGENARRASLKVSSGISIGERGFGAFSPPTGTLSSTNRRKKSRGAKQQLESGFLLLWNNF